MSVIRASSLATAPSRNTAPSAGRLILAQWCAPGVGDAGGRIMNNWEDPSENAELTREKQQAADRAVEGVESGMVVGLGAGSTAILAVRRIGQLLREGRLRDIVGVPCSSAIEAEARALGIPITLDPIGAVDLTIDGADEVDPELNLIKGGGGALLHEKIVAQASRREIIIVDAGKLSPVLGTNWPLPVEIVPFGG